MAAPHITIAVARHARRNEGSWAWIDVHGHGKARWMPTGDIDKLYCAAVDAARRNLDVNDPLVVTVAAGDETVARSSARTADGALHAHIVTGASDGLLDNALRLGWLVDDRPVALFWSGNRVCRPAGLTAPETAALTSR